MGAFVQKNSHQSLRERIARWTEELKQEQEGDIEMNDRVNETP